MVHADPADFEDVATFCTMRIFERAENPERYGFPLLELLEPDEREQALIDYAIEKLSLPDQKADEFRSQYYRFHRYFGLTNQERCSLNLMQFMAIIRQIWEMMTVEALLDVLDHFREPQNLDRLVETALLFGRREYDGGSLLAILKTIDKATRDDLEYVKILEEIGLSVGDCDVNRSAVGQRGTMSASRLSLEKKARKLKELNGLKVISQIRNFATDWSVSVDVRSITDAAMNELNKVISLWAPMDICADVTEFVVRHVDDAATVQQIPMSSEHLASQCNRPVGTVCLPCSVAAALNKESGDCHEGFDPPSCCTRKSFVKLFAHPATPEYEKDECVTCGHVKTVHYQAISPGCGSCQTCLRHCNQLWDLVGKVAQSDTSISATPSHAFRGVGDPAPANVVWAEMPLISRKIVLAQALGRAGSTLYSHICEELFLAIGVPPPLATNHCALTVDSRTDLTFEDVDHSQTIDVPIPRLFNLLLENGYFANAFDIIRSKYLELKEPHDPSDWQQLQTFSRWFNFMNLYFTDQCTSLARAKPAQSVHNVTPYGLGTDFSNQILIRAGENYTYSVQKRVCTQFVELILQFVEFIETKARCSALMSPPVVDLNFASTDFATVQGSTALSIVKFRRGKRLGKGSFGEVYEVTAGSLRSALKILHLNGCPIAPFEALSAPSGSTFLAAPLSSWFDINDNKMYILMPRFTTNLESYIKSKKRHATSDWNDLKIAEYRVNAAYVAKEVLEQVTFFNSQQFYHGDIHAGNIFLLLDENEAIAAITLGDFGLAYFDRTCRNQPGTPVARGSTSEGVELSNLRTYIIQYMLGDIRKYLSDEELRCGWQERGPGIEVTAEEMRDDAGKALGRTLIHLILAEVSMAQETTQMRANDLPLALRPWFMKLKGHLIDVIVETEEWKHSPNPMLKLAPLVLERWKQEAEKLITFAENQSGPKI